MAYSVIDDSLQIFFVKNKYSLQISMPPPLNLNLYKNEV